MTKLEAIRQLRNYDHAFLTPEGVKEFTKPFGFEGSVVHALDSRSKFKGLHLYNRLEGEGAKGQDASIVAKEIADHLGVDYPSQFGRGSQLRVCCDAVEKHLT